MKNFYAVVANALTASSTNMFVWFAVTFWAYLQTQSVVVTSVLAGAYTVTVALSGFLLGSVVDRFHKKRVMLLSSVVSFGLYALAAVIYRASPAEAFTDASSVTLWVFILLALFGALAGNLRGIALATLVTLMVPADTRDKANGLVGTANGVSFLFASIFSGLVIGYLGAFWMLVAALALTALAIAHLLTLSIPGRAPAAAAAGGAEAAPAAAPASTLDLRGTIRVIALVPGLFGLIFFQTFNNFLGGVFMSLLDAYGLELVPVQVWGAIFGVLSLGFIVGGMVVARRGLGRNPLRTLFLANIAMWTISILFTVQPWIVLLTAGMFIWLCLAPVAEAAEQTILQKVVPPERQGRVFGFAQSVEQAASPITAFIIGPIAQFIFIPFMTTGAGVDLLGGWFGTGTNRGLALLFITAGAIGLVVTLLAMRSRAYRALSENYRNHHAAQAEAAPEAAPAQPRAEANPYSQAT